MNIQSIVDFTKANPDKFYVKEDDFILDLQTGTVLAINIIDDTLVGQMPKDRIALWRREVETAVKQEEITPEILEKFDQKYKT